MISTMPKKGYPILKILCIVAAIYAFKNRAEIQHGLSDFLAKNQTVQEAKQSLKWAYDELRPRTEAEKAQQESFAAEQRKKADEYRKMGIKPHIQYVTPGDPEWKEAAEFAGKLKRGDRID